MTPTLAPIAPWPLVILAGLLVLGLSLWTYAPKLRSAQGRWRWLVLGLRIAAILLCILATLKPSLLLIRKIRQEQAILLLLDRSASMQITDEANNRGRYQVATQTLKDAVKRLGQSHPDLTVKTFAFDESLANLDPASETLDEPPAGVATALGDALEEVLKQATGERIVAVVLLTEGANNAGIPPVLAAERYRAQQTPIVAVGFGSEAAGAASRDLVARDLIVGPSVFVKNQAGIRAVVEARGYPGQTVDVELYVEDSPVPVDRKKVEIRDAGQVIPITDFKWIPDAPGETKVTFKVVPRDDELVPANNTLSTYVNVLPGGLAVLYLQGPNFSWEYKFLTRALDAAPEIQATLRVLRRSATDDPSVLPDEELAPGRFDVVILGDLPADFLTRGQIAALRRAVESGAGLMMLGGRSSFGAGGWANTELAEILPTDIHAGDGQIEPADGVRIIPELTGLENFVLRVGTDAAQTRDIWARLPRLPGVNRLGPAKRSAIILARIEGGRDEPVMVAQDVGAGRVLAFGGETWPWARYSDDSQLAHRKFWRQAILWLAHKEDAGADQVKLTLDRRRIESGQRLDMRVAARDAQGKAMTDLLYETTVSPVKPDAAAAGPERVELFNQGDDARGSYFATGQPGEYLVRVRATRNGAEVGSDQARFLVYADNREMENPSADFALLRQLAEISGGETLAPEQLGEFLDKLDPEQTVETAVQREVRLWDNWPFLLLFVGVIVTEWWVRKRHGWI